VNLKDRDVLIATWFGLGLLPKAPGTWGSLGALPFGAALIYLAGPLGLIVGIALITVLGYHATERFQKKFNVADDQRIVIDEVAGQWIALYAAGLEPLYIFHSFVLFRLFDVIKPWPCRRLEKLPNKAWGVMADDIAAGVYALLCLLGIRYAGLG
jgi:phosphatidylglycerophosphatase A